MWKRPLGKQCGTDYYLTELHGLSCNGGNCAERALWKSSHVYAPEHQSLFCQVTGLGCTVKGLESIKTGHWNMPRMLALNYRENIDTEPNHHVRYRNHTRTDSTPCEATQEEV